MGENEVTVGGSSADINPGTYRAFFSWSQVKTSEQWGDFRIWAFWIDPVGDVSGGSSMAVGPKSKGGRWLAALLGRVPERGERIDLDALVGRPCLVVVGLNKDDWPEIADVLPPMAEQVATAPQPVQAAPVAAQPQAPVLQAGGVAVPVSPAAAAPAGPPARPIAPQPTPAPAPVAVPQPQPVAIPQPVAAAQPIAAPQAVAGQPLPSELPF